MPSSESVNDGRCHGCGFGWSQECDIGNWYCGCGAAHGHDPMVKSKCVWLFRRDGSVVR